MILKSYLYVDIKNSLWGSYELPDDGVGTPKHVAAFDWTSQSGHLMHLLGFYKDIYQNARSNHQDSAYPLS
jgi:hypothetical protein